MTGAIRQALASDIAAIQRVRRVVRENRLVSTVITDEDVLESIERTGRGWVVEADGEVVAFAIGNATNGNIWALFVDPDHQRRGYGRMLHDTMIDWLRSRGVEHLGSPRSREPGPRSSRWPPAGSSEE
jgi:GNAT superfamily N-acetyltransferase